MFAARFTHWGGVVQPNQPHSHIKNEFAPSEANAS